MNKTNHRRNGFSLIELLVAIVIIGIIAAIAVPNLIAARRAANEGAAISNLKAITGAQATHKSVNTEFTDLTQLNSAGMIDSSLSGATSPSNAKSGYWYEVAADATIPKYYWNATASPQTHVSVSIFAGTGSRHFYTNESGLIYESLDGNAPTVNDSTREVSGGSPLS